tara:strand:+ start:7817 stop:7939 length:123 start_codon:yes stop_codon:yes gene_type:complete
MELGFFILAVSIGILVTALALFLFMAVKYVTEIIKDESEW